jgi:hypothetical protein
MWLAIRRSIDPKSEAGHNRRVRRSRSAFAFLGLAAVLSPWAGAVAALAHGHGFASHHAHPGLPADEWHHGQRGLASNDHHDNEDHDHAADFQQVWHGHQHDTTTPEHSHPSVFASAPAAFAPAAPRLVPSHGSHSIEYAGSRVGLNLDAGRAAPALRAAGLSPPLEPPTILRV